MTKKRALADVASKQLPLPLVQGRTNAVRAGMLARKEAVREALTLDLAECGLSREAVASEVSRLTGERISRNHLDNWCSDAKREWRLPLELVTALCAVTGSLRLLRAVLDGTDTMLADEETMTLAEYGRILLEDKKRAAKRRELQERLGL